MKTINNELIRSFNPCYDPSRCVKDENENLPVLEWVTKYRGTVPDKDIIWLLCHKVFLSDKDLRLFAVWCAREALKLVAEPDPRSVEACNVAERYANGKATDEELEVAHSSADAVAPYYAAYAATYATSADAEAAYYAAYYAYYATYATYRATISASQLDKLLTYFK